MTEGRQLNAGGAAAPGLWARRVALYRQPWAVATPQATPAVVTLPGAGMRRARSGANGVLTNEQAGALRCA